MSDPYADLVPIQVYNRDFPNRKVKHIHRGSVPKLDGQPISHTLHCNPEITCPLVLTKPLCCCGCGWTNRHLELACEDCDLAVLARLTLGQVDELWCQDRIGQAHYEAFRHGWALLSPSGARSEWATIPDLDDTRRALGKLLSMHGRTLAEFEAAEWELSA